MIPSPSISGVYLSTCELALSANFWIPDLAPARTRPIIGFIRSRFAFIVDIANFFAFDAISPKKPEPCFSACSGCRVKV